MFIVALFIAAKNLEQPMCSSTDGLNFKLIVVYLYNEIKLSNKKEWVIDTYNMNFKNIMLKKNPYTKQHRVYDSIYTKF